MQACELRAASWIWVHFDREVKGIWVALHIGKRRNQWVSPIHRFMCHLPDISAKCEKGIANATKTEIRNWTVWIQEVLILVSPSTWLSVALHSLKIAQRQKTSPRMQRGAAAEWHAVSSVVSPFCFAISVLLGTETRYDYIRNSRRHRTLARPQRDGGTSTPPSCPRCSCSGHRAWIPLSLYLLLNLTRITKPHSCRREAPFWPTIQ